MFERLYSKAVSRAGIYAVGDIRGMQIRQAAAADNTIAAIHAAR